LSYQFDRELGFIFSGVATRGAIIGLKLDLNVLSELIEA
jgi:hypothetical protein